MKKTDKPKQAPKCQGRVPKPAKGIKELTDQALEWVQGGCGTGMSKAIQTER